MVNRRGRPAKHYVTTWGETIAGLCLRANGRFWPVGRNDVSFGNDEARAINRFRRWQNEQGKPPLHIAKIRGTERPIS